MIPPGNKDAIISINNATPVPPPPLPVPAAPAQLGSAPGQKPPLPTITIAPESVTNIGTTASTMGPESLIDYAQNIRKAVVDGYVREGVVPKGTADKLLFGGMLKDLVDTEFAKKKADTDAKAGASAATIAAVLDAIAKDKGRPIDGTVTDVTPKTLPPNIPVAQLVPGEAETEPAQMDIDSFMRSTDPTAGKAG